MSAALLGCSLKNQLAYGSLLTSSGLSVSTSLTASTVPAIGA